LGGSLGIPRDFSSRVSVLTIPTNVLLIVPDVRIGDTEYHVKITKVCGRHGRYQSSYHISIEAKIPFRIDCVQAY